MGRKGMKPGERKIWRKMQKGNLGVEKAAGETRRERGFGLEDSHSNNKKIGGIGQKQKEWTKKV
jgi:hypothetical protein